MSITGDRMRDLVKSMEATIEMQSQMIETLTQEVKRLEKLTSSSSDDSFSQLQPLPSGSYIKPKYEVHYFMSMGPAITSEEIKNMRLQFPIWPNGF